MTRTRPQDLPMTISGRITCTTLVSALIVGPSQVAANPCRDAVAPLIEAAREIQAAYRPAELSGDRAEACRLASLHVVNLEQRARALAEMPASCAPVRRDLLRQQVARDRVAWLGKAARHCAPGAGASRQQHRIIKVD